MVDIWLCLFASFLIGFLCCWLVIALWLHDVFFVPLIDAIRYELDDYMK